MMKRILVMAGLSVILTGCGQPAPKTEAIVKPQDGMAETFKGCTWQKVSGATLSIWSYACGADSNGVHIVADDTLPGFSMVSNGDKGIMTYEPVIRTFTKPADATIDAILPQIRKMSPGPHTDTCTLVATADPVDAKRKVYDFEPTGAVKTAWDKNAEAGGPMPPPCGEMGVSFVGDRLFEVMTDDPTKVVYANMGSEIQIFDITTIKSVAAK